MIKIDKKKLTVVLGKSRENSDSSLKNLLEQKNIEVWECIDGIDVIRKSFEKKPDLILIDIDLPLLNGYLCAKLLKSDPFMQSTPIIHTGLSNSPIEQYRSRFCRADGYMSKPVDEMMLDRILRDFTDRRHTKRRLLAPASILPDVDDLHIMAMVNNLLEQDLLRENILNEINMIDIRSMSTNDLVSSLMTIIGALFDFDLGAALLIYDFNGELFFYQNTQTNPDRFEEIQSLMLKYLKDRHEIYLNPKKISKTILESTEIKEPSKITGDIYIHSTDEGPIRSILAFENIEFNDLRKDEQEILQHALTLVHGVLEKKIFFQMSQELSMIDTATEGYSMTFFLAVLRREIENARRNGYPLTLFTIVVSNYVNIANRLSQNKKHALTRIVYSLILKAMRKSDVAARWDTASFAFLLSHTPIEKARVAQRRICMYIKQHLQKYLSSATEVVLDTGITQLDPESDVTPEIFFAQAKPPESD